MCFGAVKAPLDENIEGVDPLDLFDMAPWTYEALCGGGMDSSYNNQADNNVSMQYNFPQGMMSFQTLPQHNSKQLPQYVETTDDFDKVLGFKEEPIHVMEMTQQIESTQASSAQDSSRKAPPTVTTIYEPKFFEIFTAYQQAVVLGTPLEQLNVAPRNQHLMTLCLNNLLPFSKWARENTNAEWVRATLFENQDIRPEVRNGLAMILVYTFAAAKAADANEVNAKTGASVAINKSKNNHHQQIDMFTVLMKAESGLGIVNKTSLKIYSDPYGYFNFLKMCITGLIDANAIPENERQNIPSAKKSRRATENKSEVECFDTIKKGLAEMFVSADNLPQIKERLKIITAIWNKKGRNLRNERFACILQANFDQVAAELAATAAAAATAKATAQQGNKQQSHEPTTVSSMDCSTQEMNYDISPIAMNFNYPPCGAFTEMAMSYNGNTTTHSNHMQPLPVKLLCTTRQCSDVDSISSSYEQPALPRNSFYSLTASQTTDGTIDQRKQPYSPSSSLETHLTYEMKTSCASNKRRVTESSGDDSMQTSLVGVPAMRFDHLGSAHWMATNTFLFEWQSIQQQCAQQAMNFFLVDEVLLKKHLSEHAEEYGVKGMSNHALEEESIFQLQGVRSGSENMSLEKILYRSGSVMTSWSSLDAKQMVQFMESWQRNMQEMKVKSAGGVCSLEQESCDGLLGKKRLFSAQSTEAAADNLPISLLGYWKSMQLTNKMTTMATMGQGVLVYERSQQRGLIVRASAAHNLTYDAWCLYYPEEASLMSQLSGNASFYEYLMLMLPQLRHVNMSEKITVGYYAHKQVRYESGKEEMMSIGSGASSPTTTVASSCSSGYSWQHEEEMGPPTAPMPSHYRTVGSLDQPYKEVLAKLCKNATFDDLFLF